jgi:hypothetical protein
MRCLLCVSGESMMSLMSDVLGMHGHASEAESHEACGGTRACGYGVVGHVVTLEPFPTGWRARCHGARGDVRALPHQEAGLELRDMWRHRCSSLSGGGQWGGSGATGHVTTPEPFPVGWRARCHGACGDVRALRHQERVWSRGDMW